MGRGILGESKEEMDKGKRSGETVPGEGYKCLQAERVKGREGERERQSASKA